MAITFQELMDHALHAVGGSAPAFPGDTARTETSAAAHVVNLAGEWMLNIRDWEWLSPPPVTLAYVQDQAYIDLSVATTGFKSIISVVPDDSTDSTFTLTSLKHLLELREYSITTTAAYYGALSWRVQTGTTAYQPSAPYLELYPTPSAVNATALQLWYSRGWTYLDNTLSVANVPEWMIGLLIECVRAYAKGLEEDDAATTDQRLASVAQGPIMAAAITRDSQAQREFGEMMGGWTELRPTPLTWNPASAPS